MFLAKTKRDKQYKQNQQVSQQAQQASDQRAQAQQQKVQFEFSEALNPEAHKKAQNSPQKKPGKSN